MNSIIRLVETKFFPERNAALSPIPNAVTLGMPHLCLTGLSETWLLKECGHRHWFLLAQAAGRAMPNFCDQAGQPVYAAFLAVSVRDAAFEIARENDQLAFASRLVPNSRTRFTSLHRLTVRGQAVGEFLMVSTFVRRAKEGKNHTIARIELPGLPVAAADPHADAQAAEMMALRSGEWLTHLGFDRCGASVLDRLVIDPCPAQDFNGADFLYFASYQAFVDRAEWAHSRPRAPFPTTRRRDLVYYGNIDPGERVVVTLTQRRQDNESLSHWYRMTREQDGVAIADVFTLRAARAQT